MVEIQRYFGADLYLKHLLLSAILLLHITTVHGNIRLHNIFHDMDQYYSFIEIRE